MRHAYCAHSKSISDDICNGAFHMRKFTIYTTHIIRYTVYGVVYIRYDTKRHFLYDAEMCEKFLYTRKQNMQQCKTSLRYSYAKLWMVHSFGRICCTTTCVVYTKYSLAAWCAHTQTIAI